VEAITEWARGTVGDVTLPSVGNGPECQICPVCQLLALLRRTQPETFGHLADASASMVAALRSVIDRQDHARHSGGVERIDLDHNEGPPDDAAGTTAQDGDREALADALGVSPRRRSARPRGSST
jgi:hypothetical protein